MKTFTAYKNKSKGFSLIELMVSLTIFSIVMTISMGTLLVLIDANAKAQALSSAMTNLSFAMDSMTRSIRTGKDYYCAAAASVAGTSAFNSNTQDCISGNTAIIFTPGFESEWRMAYRLNGTSIEQRIDKNGVAGDWVAITSDQQPAAVVVDTLTFVVEGSADTAAASPDFDQPRISLLVAGSVQNGLVNATRFQIQSNVTQRVLNY